MNKKKKKTGKQKNKKSNQSNFQIQVNGNTASQSKSPALKKKSTSNKNSLLVNLSLILLSITILFIILEIGARIILKPDYDKWFVGPSFDQREWLEAHVENKHQRTRQANVYYYENRINILGLGDSFTFASGVYDNSRTHLSILEKKLIESSIPASVNNFAIPGNNIKEIVESVTTGSSRLNPDIVLYSFYLNDLARGEKDKPKIGRINLLPFAGSLLENSYFYFYINNIFSSTVKGFFYKNELYDYYRMLYREENLKLFEIDLKKIKNTCEEFNAELIVSILPVMDDFQKYKFREFHDMISDILEKNSIIYFDNLNAFSSKVNSRELWVNPYDSHPNEIAQEIISENGYKFIKGYLEENHRSKLSHLSMTGKIYSYSGYGVKINSVGRQLYKEGKYNEAVKVFLQDLNEERNNFLLYTWIADCYYRIGQHDLALKNIKRSIEIKPDHLNSQKILAQIYIDRNEFEKALDICKKAYSIKSDDPIINMRLSIVYLRMNQPDKSKKHIDWLINFDPEDPEYRFLLGNYYLVKQQIDNAIETYKKSLELDPQHISSSVNLAHIYSNQGRFQKAVDICIHGLQKEPNNTYMLNTVSKAYLGLKKYDLAKEFLFRLISIDPEESNAHYILSKTYFLQRKFDLAWKELRIAENKGGRIETTYLNLLSKAFPDPDKK